MYPIRIGFITGPGGNPTGIGDHVRALDAAGIPVTIFANDVSTGHSDVIALWQQGSVVNHRLAYRIVLGGDESYAVPDYDLEPDPAGDAYYAKLRPKIPPHVEAWKSRIKLIIFNEVDKNRASWLGYCALKVAQNFNAEGFSVMAFNFASGEPEPAHWRTEGMRAYLEYCGNNPHMAGVGLHEYSYHNSDLLNGAGHLLGRYMELYDACDEMGLPYPEVWITEFGYTLNTVPGVETHWKNLVAMYEEFPDYPPAGTWYLGSGWSSIANLAQKYIQPSSDWHRYNKIAGALAPIGVWPEEPGPANPGFARVRFKRKVYRFHSRTYDMIQSGELSFESFWAIFVQVLQERSEFSISNDGASIGVGPDGDPLDRFVIEVGGEFNAIEIENWYLSEYGIPKENVSHIPFPAVGVVFSGYAWPVRPLHPTDWGTVDVWPGGWFDANGYGNLYQIRPGVWHYHTGADLNNNRPKWDADRGAEIYAIADGVITFAGWLDVWGNVMILEIDDPERGKVYARYGHVDKMYFVAGDRVQKMELIATVGQDAAGGPAHIHFDITRPGDTILRAKPWHWPGTDEAQVYEHYVDPGEFLADAEAEYHYPPSPLPGTHDVAFGVHASADAHNMTQAEKGGAILSDMELMEMADFELVKFLSSHNPADVRAMASLNPLGTFIVRTFLSMAGRNISPRQFYDDTIADTRRTIEALRQVGVIDDQILIEVGANEANLTTEGATTSWANGAEYAVWFGEVLTLYLAAFENDPEIRFVFSGLSPGEAIPGLRQHYHEYLRECAPQIARCDALGVHTYWSPPYPMLTHPDAGVGPVDYAIANFKGQTIFVTECSHNGGGVGEIPKAESVLQFWTEMKKRPAVEGIAYFVMSASNSVWQHQNGSGEVLTDEMATVFANR